MVEATCEELIFDTALLQVKFIEELSPEILKGIKESENSTKLRKFLNIIDDYDNGLEAKMKIREYFRYRQSSKSRLEK